MSDAGDDVVRGGRKAVQAAEVDGLRRRLEAFLRAHDRAIDLHDLRVETSGGTSMSDVIDSGRDDRV